MATQTVAPAPETTTLWRTARAVLALPVTVTVLIPLVILYGSGMQVPSWMSDQMSMTATAIGTLLVAAGLFLVTRTVMLFHQTGKGSLAPFDPPVRLVVLGPYRHMRNPMITGVIAILLGEALAVNSMGLLIYAAVFVAVNAIYFPLVEERGLLRRFGRDYAEYAHHVPRWVPRLSPWTQPESAR
ncbi:isoprenylcysteine carboxylmethyltransferase family protein [Mycobacteroides chelonae]|nr:isoprenylcysteine carboxylmethyltransferase family protein [Mycobacteroides chelonae]